MCDLFFFVPTLLPLEYFLPDVINNGNVFSLLSMRVPNIFFTFKRILMASKDVKGFKNKNTSQQAQPFKKNVKLLIITMDIEARSLVSLK
jgi:hypothetical protein